MCKGRVMINNEQTHYLEVKNFINGEFVGDFDDCIEVRDKYYQHSIAKVSKPTDTDISMCLESSYEAFVRNKYLSMEDRYNFIEQFKNKLIEEKDKFIEIMIAESGKPKTFVQTEFYRSVKVCELTLAMLYHDLGETHQIDYGAGKGKTALSKRFPIGPVLAMSPFNFPLNLAMHKVIPALALGCSVILKPSPHTPLTAQALGGIAKKIQLPEGLLNIVLASNEQTLEMLQDPRIKMLSFTGSDKVGWHLKSLASKMKVTLELGGNAAVIIDRSAMTSEEQFHSIVKKCVTGAFLNAGQVCISIQRIYIDEDIYEKFKEAFLTQVREVVVGNPNDPETLVGPLIDQVSLIRISQWVQEAIENGSQLLYGGEVLDSEKNLFMPTVFENVPLDLKIVGEEVFAPVVSLFKVRYFDQAIKDINASRFGLQAGLFTNQHSQIQYAYNHLEVGALIINEIPGFRVDSMPYGGIKDSGFGREGIKNTFYEMTEPKLLIY